MVRPTSRSAGLAVLGVAVLVLAWASGQQDMVRVGVFCLALPALGLLSALLERPALSAERTLAPPVARRGEPVVVSLALNAPDAAAPPARIVDDPGPGLGSPRMFTLDPVRDAGATARYELHPRRRGRFPMNTCSYRVDEPLGLWSRHIRLDLSTPLLVTPQIHPLPRITLPVQGGLGETPLPRTALRGPDDATVRNYAAGDDVRRIHWRATAHVGELMVRREEAAWDPTAWIVLDSRADAFALVADERPGFEWLVSAAASLGIRLLEDGYSLGLVDAEGRVHTVDQHLPAGSARWIDPLIDVDVTQDSSLQEAAGHLSREPDEAVVIALLARLDDTATEPLLQLGSPSQTRIALVLWTDDSETLAHGRSVLENHGWIVQMSGPGGNLADDWRELDLQDVRR